jgi:hypothetical protein
MSVIYNVEVLNCRSFIMSSTPSLIVPGYQNVNWAQQNVHLFVF